MDESFISFLTFVLVMAFVFSLFGRVSDDMTKRGVFGKEEQKKALQKDTVIYVGQNPNYSNTASIYGMW
ncbi:MAG: hypothetical protein WC631_02970 [Candidatus Paceibacterota bacterium]|jgi:hypothetical protein